MQFFARTMRYSDVGRVAQNEMAANEHPWSERIFIDCLKAGYQCWVLANKRQVVAHGVLSVAVGKCHLLTLCVHPDFQRQGYGRKIFTLLLERARKLGASVCFLEVRRSNESAIKLYRSMGFARIGERQEYYPGAGDREDAIIMSRSLPIS